MDVFALHIGNGIIEGPVAAAFGAVAIVSLAVCVARSRAELDDRLAPMAGLVAAFVFAAQMLNFPIFTAAVSGHLIGATLAATLVGPWVGALCLSVVLIIQALVFADGGVTALGLNVTNMALVGTAVGYLLVALLLRILPRSNAGLAATAFVAALLSVLAAAMSFVAEYAIGGAMDLGGSITVLAGTVAGTHLLIGVGEGVITAVTVVAVAKVRPDLVYALRRSRRPAQESVVTAGSPS